MFSTSQARRPMQADGVTPISYAGLLNMPYRPGVVLKK